MKHQRSHSEIIFDAANLLFLGLLSMAALYPFLYTLNLSLADSRTALNPGLLLWPRQFHLTSYKIVLQTPEILTGLQNTLLRTIVGTFATLLCTALTAYPLARKNFPGRRRILIFILISMLFSGGIIPNYLLIKNLGLMDNILVYILPGLVTGFNIIIMRNFFQTIPESLAESARIDGAGECTILFRIYLPLSAPILATIGLWTAVAHWNAWFDALLYINDDSKQVLQMFLQRVVIANNTELIEKGLLQPEVLQYTSETIKAAAIMVTVIPIVFLYPLLQKYFLKGLLIGGIKE